MKSYHQLQMLNQNPNVEEQLTDVDSTSSRKSSMFEEPAISKKKRYSKKRIGPYCYRSRNVVGCGFSSLVYKGTKNEDKTNLVAIKVVQLADLCQSRRILLSNEVKFMKKLNHPNIVKLLDVYYTVNNCYIITEFCEGGSLQHYIDANDDIDAESVIKQIGGACQYLVSMNILHRDIKPANILLKQGAWKLGDFGFSQQLPHFNATIKGDYLIGSPLFMPIQSLTMNHYSSKTDSFAMGVLIFYILTGNYPWKVQAKNQLIYQLNNTPPNQKYLNLLPSKIKYYVESLLSREMSQRMDLLDCDFQVFTHVKRLKVEEMQQNEAPNYQMFDSIPNPIDFNQL